MAFALACHHSSDVIKLQQGLWRLTGFHVFSGIKFKVTGSGFQFCCGALLLNVITVVSETQMMLSER